MLVQAAPVDELITHVYYRVADQSCRHIIQQLGLTDVIGNHYYLNSDYHAPSKSVDHNRKVIFNENNFVGVVRYNPNPMNLKYDVTSVGQHLDTAVHRRDAMQTEPLFFDPARNIQVIERYLPTNLQIECTFNFRDRVLAYDVVSRLQGVFVRGEFLTLTDFYYDYQFPKGLLSSLYRLSKLCRIPKSCFLSWLQVGSRQRLSRNISKRVNRRSTELVARKNNIDCLVSLDYSPDQLTTVSPGKGAISLTLNFTLTVQFARVHYVYLKYPIVIDNQLVPDELIPVDRRQAYDSTFRQLQHTYVAMDQALEYYKQATPEFRHWAAKPKRLPWYDDWFLPTTSQYPSLRASPFLIGVLTLDEQERRTDEQGNEQIILCPETVIDLWEPIDVYQIAPKILEQWRCNPASALDPFAEYNLAVFADDIQLESKRLCFDGRYLHIPNTFGTQHIYRLVLLRTPQIKGEVNPWFLVLCCVIETERS